MLYTKSRDMLVSLVTSNNFVVLAASYSTKYALTKELYKVERGNYATLSDKDINTFEEIVGKTRILTDPSDVEAYNVDWLHSVRGNVPWVKRCILISN